MTAAHSPESPASDGWIAIARVARPHGIRGEVIAELLTDFPQRFDELDQVRVETADGHAKVLGLESWRLHRHRVILKFEGYDTMNEAEGLRGARVVVEKAQLVSLPEDTYYDFDLIGCEVATSSGERLGQVARVERYGASPLLTIQDGEREYMIPLAREICVEIDVAKQRIVVDPPAGLLEL
jgi:16S rRNA processing protein RimM